MKKAVLLLGCALFFISFQFSLRSFFIPELSFVIPELSFVIPAQAGIQSSEEVDPYNTYQWDGKSGRWYEWWYFKLIDPQTKTPFYFVYGVVNPRDTSRKKEASRSMVTIGNFSTHTSLTKTFSPGEFQASRTETMVSIGAKNFATDKFIEGSIQEGEHYAKWRLNIKKKRGWNAMGWGLPLKIFNIWWHPAQMDATYNGTIEMDGKIYKIVDANGYQDRNWGTSFPKWWYWIVSNSFKENPESSLASGGGHAKTKHGITLPKAVLIGLYHEGEMYEFRSSDFGNRVKYDISMGKWHITAQNRRHKIELKATCDLDELEDLEFITPNGDVFHDYETLTGTLQVNLFKKKVFGWEKITTLNSIDNAGLELGLDHPYKKGRRLKGQAGILRD